MGRRRRMGDQALRIPEIVRDIDELQRVEKTEAGLFVTRDVEGDDGAAGAHLAPCQLVLRVAWQAWVDHPCHLWMAFEETRDRLGRAALPLDPQFQCFEPL